MVAALITPVLICELINIVVSLAFALFARVEASYNFWLFGIVLESVNEKKEYVSQKKI